MEIISNPTELVGVKASKESDEIIDMEREMCEIRTKVKRLLTLCSRTEEQILEEYYRARIAG